MKPVVDGLKKEYEGKVEFRTLNVEKDPSGVELANKLGVQYVPTFVYVNSDGTIVNQVVGEQAADDIRTVLDGLK